MGNKKGPGFLAGAIAGKGFYIVLFLCAAVLTASVWLLTAGTHVEDSETMEKSVDISDAVVTMLPASAASEPETAVPAAAMREDEPQSEEALSEDEGEPSEAAAEYGESVTYVWPVRGEIEIPYAVETLVYDPTMADWRTHPGLDIACAAGEQVLAAAAGTVESVEDDDLLGTTVVIDHKNGVRSVYANLAPEPPVSEGDSVVMGQVVGSVGATALAETNVVPHLHFAMIMDGGYIDPREMLPASNDE